MLRSDRRTGWPDGNAGRFCHCSEQSILNSQDSQDSQEKAHPESGGSSELADVVMLHFRVNERGEETRSRRQLKGPWLAQAKD